jgi:hypothetical protein
MTFDASPTEAALLTTGVAMSNGKESEYYGGYVCADVANGKNADGTPVHAWGCHGAPNQQFELSGQTICSVLDGAVHALDLAIGPRMLWLGQPVVDIGEGAGVFERVCSERLLAGDHLADLGWGPGIALGVGEVDAVVGQHRMDLVGHDLNQGAQSDHSISDDNFEAALAGPDRSWLWIGGLPISVHPLCWPGFSQSRPCTRGMRNRLALAGCCWGGRQPKPNGYAADLQCCLSSHMCDRAARSAKRPGAHGMR